MHLILLQPSHTLLIFIDADYLKLRNFLDALLQNTENNLSLHLKQMTSFSEFFKAAKFDLLNL